MKISISHNLKALLPDFAVAAYQFKIKNFSSLALDERLDAEEGIISQTYSLETILQDSAIKAARDAYKKLGKDPSRYRLAVESLFRRIIKGNRLYRINSVVDTGNLLSLLCKKSTAVLDSDAIIGDVTIRIGSKDDDYYGIGRGKLDVDRIPLYQDSVSPFGSPTSDTERTMIGQNTKNVTVFIISFEKMPSQNDKHLLTSLYKEYTGAYDFVEIEVDNG
jgi:DNA/RNA-binding domain of Phe-tRNA-synthetase-like protein